MKIIAVEEHAMLPNLSGMLPEGYDLRSRMAWLPELLTAMQLVNDWPTSTPPGFSNFDEERLSAMDEGNIATQIISAGIGGVNDFPVETIQKMNDALAAATVEHPGRFLGFATLPMREPEAAADELERTVTQLGFVGTMIWGHVDGRYLDDPIFDPIFARAAALDVPIYLHPTPPPQAVVDASYTGGRLHPQISAVLSKPGLGWHADTLLHLARLIVSGTFDRHPTLQVIVGHFGEGLPWLYWRGEMFDKLPSAGLQRKFVDYLRENVYAATCDYVTDPQTAHGAFLGLVHTIGIDRILTAADYPHGNCLKARKLIESLPISESDLEKIAYRNAERLFKVTAPDVSAPVAAAR